MTERYVYYLDEENLFKKKLIKFKWYPGFALVQKQRSSQDLQAEFKAVKPNSKILEVSSASANEIGRKLSAFNLMLETTHGSYSVEQIFQAGKVFERAGKQEQLLKLPSREAKAKVKVLNNTDKLVAFSIFGQNFSLEPKTFFYNWSYLHALNQNKNLAKEVVKFDAFTDIHFNYKKQLNCQAEACSIYVSLYRRDLLNKALASKESFLRIVYGDEATKSNSKRTKKQEQFVQTQLEL